VPEAIPVTLVVPLYNEAETVAYLKGTLTDLRRKLGRRYRVHFILVDDASTDSTPQQLKSLFGTFSDCQLLRHEQNTGGAGAIMTGIRAAGTEIVASIDCDCSYDPNDLELMIPMIESADLVTASPYHPQGHVFNVPPWRLFLSRRLSRMYSSLLGNATYTYTSCFRVYRKSAVETLDIQHRGFLGVAEFLIRLRLKGGRIVEYPTTLESRLFGESKMKIVRTIFSHLGLLRELAFLRLRGGGPSVPDETKAPPTAAGTGTQRVLPGAGFAPVPADNSSAGSAPAVPAQHADP
jgi:glycosyltransferase involved in cell wall biosynthesis